jgi:hypothetical protein
MSTLFSTTSIIARAGLDDMLFGSRSFDFFPTEASWPELAAQLSGTRHVAGVKSNHHGQYSAPKTKEPRQLFLVSTVS